jgi:hypothetical protein
MWGTTARVMRMSRKKVGLEDRTRLFDRALFRACGGDPEAGVVDQQVDAALPANDLGDGGVDGFITGHVESQHRERSLTPLVAPSAGAVDLVARPVELLGRGLADA